MSTPFYVSPEQLVKDRADFARQGIAKGRSVVVGSCADGVALVADNPSRSLHKISEIYDRIAFAAVGKYHEFESMRVAGIRYADSRGYAFARADVTARALANAFSQSLGLAFTQGAKPFEVELAVVEIGLEPADDELFRLRFDGSIGDEESVVVMGGRSESVGASINDTWNPDHDSTEAINVAARALLPSGISAEKAARSLEVAILQRGTPRRAFRRLEEGEVARLLATADGLGS